ncbi:MULTISPECIES: hypothetical protein [unclassified Pedobacter]|uniref:hypothetical protein n=1 Tax=unclassified Pedobacter TaxID=2628915 RepID=UPI001D80FD19|nr:MULTISPECIES: hypothetical protein [unclassified Pedobacter]CAH0186283.1 hypothetical protein SRABI36_01635 [Pedobacter sp. Bi36]CAH0242043.1 hypothetical protein SRABI126_02728 [Pedobacter sp. Bi126]
MNEGDRIKSVFLNGLIPNNSNIDKTATGNGLTTAELEADRHSIIVNPQVNTIADKKAYCIAEKINVHAIYTGEGHSLKEFLLNDTPKKKILITPESFPLLITAARKAKMEQVLYDEFFCLLDESHCFASESFREGILRPFDFFFNFKYKAMGSATPFPYTDPRILKMQRYKMIYKETAGKIQIIYGNKPQDILCTILNEWCFKGNVHVFFNTVTAIGNIIRASGITDFNIYCVDSERNQINLHEYGNRILDRPIAGQYAKYNFYSCRYVEGWDMLDDANTTMIFVTDVKVKHSLMNIGIKGVQCMGRLRNVKPINTYHITNSFNRNKRYNKSFAKVREETEWEANQQITHYNNYAKAASNDDKQISQGILDLIKPFASLVNESIAIYDHMKSNQVLYDNYTRSTYNNIDTIKHCWQESRYEAEMVIWDLETLETKNKPKNEINKAVYELIMEYRADPSLYKYGNAKKAFNSLEGKYKLLMQAIDILDKQILINTEFHDDLMKQKLIEHSNKNAETKLIIALIDEFQIGVRYSRKYIKNKLQQLYEQYSILGKTGKVKSAKATDLDELQIFNLKECKVDNDQGKRQLAYQIISTRYTLKQAS